MATPMKNLFATVLTPAAPASNYRGESEENRTVLQKINKRGLEYAFISPESMRNALREQLAKYGLPCNRRRLHDEGQLAVEFKEFPDAAKYADDFLLGYMVADQAAVKKNKSKPAKRDSVLRMNMAVAVSPYRFDAVFHQSPLNAGESPWKNASTSALVHREVSHTAFQYPFALALEDCRGHEDWAGALLKAVSELSNVAGGHARSLYEMAPRSIVLRLTPSLVAGFDSYGFDEQGDFPELARLASDDLPAAEFWIGGALVRDHISADRRKALAEAGAHLFDSPQKLLEQVARDAGIQWPKSS